MKEARSLLCSGAQLPVHTDLELVVAIMMCCTRTDVKRTRFQSELLVCQLVELLQSALIQLNSIHSIETFYHDMRCLSTDLLESS